jgi:hypothetical protein
MYNVKKEEKLKFWLRVWEGVKGRGDMTRHDKVTTDLNRKSVSEILEISNRNFQRKILQQVLIVPFGKVKILGSNM